MRNNKGQFIKIYSEKNKCISCSKDIKRSSTRCKSCAVSLRMKGKQMSTDIKRKISETLKQKGVIPPSQLKNDGSRVKHGNYMKIKIDGKWIREHNYVWIKHNQRPIPKGFVIHHRNKNGCDNSIKNLICLPVGIHVGLHNQYRHKTNEVMV